eukprot:m.67988 g.67988  ORF g.67988 m.67988 type:complete len:54 (-) comp18270_c0_seq1:97-258(-)
MVSMVEGVLSPIFQNMVEPVVPSLAGDLTPSKAVQNAAHTLHSPTTLQSPTGA